MPLVSNKIWARENEGKRLYTECAPALRGGCQSPSLQTNPLTWCSPDFITSFVGIHWPRDMSFSRAENSPAEGLWPKCQAWGRLSGEGRGRVSCLSWHRPQFAVIWFRQRAAQDTEYSCNSESATGPASSWLSKLCGAAYQTWTQVSRQGSLAPHVRSRSSLGLTSVTNACFQRDTGPVGRNPKVCCLGSLSNGEFSLVNLD